MTTKRRWPTAALRERFNGRDDAAKAYCDMRAADRDAGIELIREEWERTRAAVHVKVAFFKLFGWVPTMDELYIVTGIEV